MRIETHHSVNTGLLEANRVNPPNSEEYGEETYSRSHSLGLLVATVIFVAEVVLASVGTAREMEGSLLGLMIAVLAVSNILVLVPIHWKRESDETRLTVKIVKVIKGVVQEPPILQLAPAICGTLTATGHLSSHTTSVVTLGITGALLLLTACRNCCISFVPVQNSI